MSSPDEQSVSWKSGRGNSQSGYAISQDSRPAKSQSWTWEENSTFHQMSFWSGKSLPVSQWMSQQRQLSYLKENEKFKSLTRLHRQETNAVVTRPIMTPGNMCIMQQMSTTPHCSFVLYFTLIISQQKKNTYKFTYIKKTKMPREGQKQEQVPL